MNTIVLLLLLAAPFLILPIVIVSTPKTETSGSATETKRRGPDGASADTVPEWNRMTRLRIATGIQGDFIGE